MTGSDVDLAILEWAGSAPDLVFVHATGFCKETWRPVVEELAGSGSPRAAVAVDQRGHGDSTVPRPPFDWWDLGRDALLIARSREQGVVAGVGHSSGAAALIMAELLAPGTFPVLVLIEPIVFPPPYLERSSQPMADRARRRRASFGSRQDALESYRGRGPFAAWDDRALEAYVDGAFRPGGGGIELKCAPDVEAEFYLASGAHGSWDRLGEIEAEVTLVAGELSDTHGGGFAARQAAQFAAADLMVIPEATHFVPMEQPATVAGLVAAALARSATAGDDGKAQPAS